MTDEPMAVAKHGFALSASPELLVAAKVLSDLPRRLDRALNATPEERAAWAREADRREAEAAQLRAEERATTASAPLTLDALLVKMGWSREYAEHLVQPYCTCGDDIDGWSYCEHARDLGLAP